MATLRSLFASAGATDVVTLLNSGNVVFSGSHLLIVPGDRMCPIAAAFPYEGDDSKLVVAFMPTVPPAELPDIAPEPLPLGAEAVYQSLPNGVSNTKLKPAFWKQFPPETTARNLRTVKKVLELLYAP